MQVEEIKALLQQEIPQCQADVNIEGSHVHLVVVSELFDGVSPVKRQQRVNRALSGAIASGAIHAVHIKALTPDQAAGQ